MIETGLGELDCLPARGGLVGERGLGEQFAVGFPQAADVRAGVGRSLVEAHAGDLPGDFGGELDAELDRGAVAGVDRAAGWSGEVEDCVLGATAPEVAEVAGPDAVDGADLERVAVPLFRPVMVAEVIEGLLIVTGVSAVDPDVGRHA